MKSKRVIELIKIDKEIGLLGNKFQTLLNQRDKSPSSSFMDYSPLMEACANCNHEEVDFLIKHKANINLLTNKGGINAIIAIFLEPNKTSPFRKISLVKKLLLNGASLPKFDENIVYAGFGNYPFSIKDFLGDVLSSRIEKIISQRISPNKKGFLEKVMNKIKLSYKLLREFTKK